MTLVGETKSHLTKSEGWTVSIDECGNLSLTKHGNYPIDISPDVATEVAELLLTAAPRAVRVHELYIAKEEDIQAKRMDYAEQIVSIITAPIPK
jgi:hypothetical protein